MGARPDRHLDGAALRRELKRRCQPFLQPGEETRHVFVAEVGVPPNVHRTSLWFSLAGLLHAQECRLVCVTDRAIVLVGADAEWIPLGVVTRLPRDLVFGPMSGSWSGLLGLGGGLYVHWMFHADVAAADAEL